MFFSHFAMQSNYLFQWMKPSLKVMIFFQQIDKAWHQFFGRTRQNCLTPHPLLDHWMHTLTHFVMAISLLSVAASPREYLVRRAAKNVISPPQNPPNPPKKQQCKNQECLASYKKKLIACARVRCKRRVDSVAASPREYLVRRAAKNVISPPKTPPPKKQQCKNQECLASYKKKLIACARVRCKRRVDSVAASPREYLVRRAAKNAISPPQNPPQETRQPVDLAPL